jgi:hypothetical protein
MNLNYDIVCKLIGELYIEKKIKVSELEEQYSRLMIANKELEKRLKEKEDGLQSERAVN